MLTRSQDADVARIAEQVGKRCRLLREAKGLTQGELARAIGHGESTGTSYVGRFERGESGDIKLGTINRLCKVFKLSLAEFVAGIE